MTTDDTIVAISSAVGPAARMIIRLSGSRATELAKTFSHDALPSAGGAARVQLAFRGLSFPAWSYFFQSPRSYTGEDLIEFHLPGNPTLAKMLLEDLLRAGARNAEPGEFTARAYFNGRLDLTEAEGVAATIHASSEQELSAARRLMAGELSRRLAPAMDLIAETLALIEVGIDFSDEDVTFLSPQQITERITQADRKLEDLLRESVRFETLAHEPRIVLVGRPNAGKSTLLNALAGHERAVVSPVAGTTRDVLWAEVPLRRGVIRLIDVAGVEEPPNDGLPNIRDSVLTPSPGTPGEGGGEGLDLGNLETEALARIDRLMREHALRELQSADRVVLVRDITDSRPDPDLPRKPDLLVLSKSDLSPDVADPTALLISATTGVGLDHLRDALDDLAFGPTSAGSALALNARHLRAIEEARQTLASAAQQIRATPELISLELRESLDALGAIRGQITPDDLLGRIFSTFCIGK